MSKTRQLLEPNKIEVDGYFLGHMIATMNR
jgi:hypothetical protein